ncbi:MAG: hypothetical protein DCC88_05250 [Spirobacillus cienkowskii]|uniref:Lipoprotein n=1 Tax=Spirobacillus cienkowskii TaxID=495820 RepID=A0A369KRN9_9BACT|nr:MAG: hypothetical protein DCC88_05250 [Spirobacillus cienkowskii]
MIKKSLLLFIAAFSCYLCVSCTNEQPKRINKNHQTCKSYIDKKNGKSTCNPIGYEDTPS